MSSNWTRRSFLASSSAAAVFGSSAAAFPEERSSKSLKEAGITDQYSELMRTGEIAKARSLLEENNVRHRSSTVQVPSLKHGGFVPSGIVNKSASRFFLDTAQVEDNIYRAGMHWELSSSENAGDILDCSGKKDIVAITYSGDLWEPEAGTQVMSDLCSDYNPDGDGVTCRYDDAEWFVNPSDVYLGYFELYLEKTEPGEHNVYADYSHTWATCSPYQPGGIQFSVAVGNLSVTATGAHHKWTHAVPVQEI